MLASQWLDVFFVPLFLMGVETIDPGDPANPNAYGGGVIHAVYTHSLVGAVLLSVLAGVLAWAVWGRRVGGVIAAVAFSHWLLDLLVHRPDLPILPGNAGGLPQLGCGRCPCWPAFSSCFWFSAARTSTTAGLRSCLLGRKTGASIGAESQRRPRW
jgi:hypothetical protein